MPHEITVPTVTQDIEWKDLREGLKNCIKAAVSEDVLVYASWPLKYDIGETINLISSKDGKVHAWMISINEADPQDRKAGGYSLEWDLNVRIWGFLGYDSTYSGDTQDTLEKELRKITFITYANAKHFGMANTQGLETDGLISWEDIDVHAFGSGDDVHVAQGSLKVKLKTFLSDY